MFHKKYGYHAKNIPKMGFNQQEKCLLERIESAALIDVINTLYKQG